jgi:hypothetical protein
MNHGRKFAFCFLLLSILMLPRFAAAQAKQPAILQVQNNGVTAGTGVNYFKLNFTTGCTATYTSGGFNIACTGGAGNPGGSANQIQYNNAGTSFGAFTMTGDCSIVVSTGIITCTKSNGTAFGTAAFISSTAGGDLNGTLPSPTVKGINGTALSGLATGLLKNTTITGVPSIAAYTDITALWSTCTGTQYLGFDGNCHTASGSPGSPSLSMQGNVSGAFAAIPGTAFSASNGITEFQICGPSPYIDVTCPLYGADPTGVADSSTAIQNAFNECSGATYPVYFPPGTYKQAAQIANNNSCTVFAQPGTVTINKAYNASGGTFPQNIGAWQINASNVAILGITYNGGYTSGFTGPCITDVQNNTNVRIQNNTISNCDLNPLVLSATSSGGTGPSTVQILDNTITSSASPHSSGTISLQETVSGVIISRNVLDASQTTFTSGPADIEMESQGKTTTISGVTITDNHMLCPSQTGSSGWCIQGGPFNAYQMVDIVIANNTYDFVGSGTSVTGCVSIEFVVGLILNNNTCNFNYMTNNYTGFEVFADKATVVGNTLNVESPGDNAGITLVNVNNSTISSNVINGGGEGTGSNVSAGIIIGGTHGSNAISTMTESGNIVTVTTTAALNTWFLPGATVNITGATTTGYNIAGPILNTGYNQSSGVFEMYNPTGSLASCSGACTTSATVNSQQNNNTVVGNTITLPCGGTLAGNHYGFMVRPLGTNEVANNNKIANNTVIGCGNGTANSYGVDVTGNVGGTNNTVLSSNHFVNLAAGIWNNAGLDTYAVNNTFVNVTTPITFASGSGSMAASTTPLAFANLDTCSTTLEGNYAAVTDSTTNTNGATITGSGSNAVSAYCNGTNWVVASGTGTGGPGTGTQYTHPYWSSISALGSVAPTTGYDGVPQQETNSTTSGVFTAAPVSAPQGVPVDIESGATFTVALTDRSKVLNTTNTSTSTAVTVPAPSTTGFGLNFVFAHLNSGTVVATDTPTTATVNGNSAMKLVGAVSGHNPEAAFWWEDSSTSCSSGPCYWGAEILPTDANGRLGAEGFGALTGDVTNTAGSYGTTVGKVNGGAVPASAAVVGTNSSSQFVAVTNAMTDSSTTTTQGEVPLSTTTAGVYAPGDLWLGEFIPAANCNNTTAGAGWSIPSGGTVTCRAGTNNLGGYITITDTSSTFAQFTERIPFDWDTASRPYIRFFFSSASDTTSGHTVIPQVKVSCSQAVNGTTSDDATFTAAQSSSTVTFGASAVANGFYGTSNVQFGSTQMTGCTAGGLFIVQVGRATDTATGNINFYGVDVTWPHLNPGTAQAN